MLMNDAASHHNQGTVGQVVRLWLGRDWRTTVG